MDRILIVYATREGQTRRIAEHLAATARSRELEADVINARQLPSDFSFAPYRAAIVAAGPVYRGNRGECRRMTKQINHYENVVLKRAQDRGDKMWEESMYAHLDRLKNRRADRCPEYREQRKVLAAMARQAAQIAYEFETSLEVGPR